jgi:glycosyltransferase involved in cell wall biosynthesis
MRILRVISSVDKKNGGPINGLLSTTPLLIEMGHEVEVLTFDKVAYGDVLNLEFPCYGFDDVKFGYRFSQKAREWLMDNISSYDAVIIHGIWQYHSYITARACMKMNIPYVLFTHGMLDPWFNKGEFLKYLKKLIYWKFIEGAVVRNARSVLFTSEVESKVSSTSFAPYKANSKVVSYGSPEALYDKSSIDDFFECYSTLRDKKFLLFLGRIHPKKGLELTIRSFPELLKHKPDYMLAIAGPDSFGEQSRLISIAKEVGIESNIVWLGMLDGVLKWGALYAAHAFILTSHQENFGIAVSEALSASLPVLISDKVNIYQTILDGRCGLVGADSVDGISEVLSEWALVDDDGVAEMSRNAYSCYLKNFSIRAAAQSIINELSEIVN